MNKMIYSRTLAFCFIEHLFAPENSISNPLVGTTLVGAVNVVATYVALLIMDRCGRKSLILWSAGGMFISCIYVTLSLVGVLNQACALLAVAAYVIFFEIGYVAQTM